MAKTYSNNREREIFDAALDLASAAERTAYVESVCRDNAALLARVQALLRAHGAPETFLPERTTQDTLTTLPAEKTGDRIGRYRLLDQIGEGGCGVVYRAEQLDPIRRQVALKIIKLGMDTKQVIGRFEAERQALALMDHPNIARVFDAGATDTGRPFFVMELVEGPKITDYCDEHHLSTEERLELFVQVCQAIQHAHQKGIIHRDIKPSNILVAERDGKPLPKVIDFGIAKATAGQVLTDKTLFTAFEQFMGTPAYMSPEQTEMSPGDVDTRSDIYALGVLLYELLTGVTPFDHGTLGKAGWDEVRRIIRETEPLKPSTRLTQVAAARGGASVPASPERSGTPDKSGLAGTLALPAKETARLLRGDLDWIVMKCLEKDRARRYASASLLALDIGHHLRHEPVLAGPPSTLYQTRKFILRYRTPVLVTVVVVCGLAVGLTGALAGLIRAKRERDRAQAILRQTDLKHAQDLFETDQVAAGLANLALLLREKPGDLAVAEWLLNELTQRSFPLPLLEPIRHNDRVLSARFSPDGSRILTVSRNSTARIWDSRTGRPLTPPLVHEPTLVGRDDFQEGLHPMFASFSPDGVRVVTGAIDKMARIWDAKTGQLLAPPLSHADWVSYVTFSPDGKLVATACKDGAVQLWNAATGKAVGKPFRHSTWANFVEFSPTGDRIITGSDDHTAQVWDTATGAKVGPPLHHGHELKCGEFSPDGERVVTAASDYTARIWNARTGEPLSPPLRHEDTVCTARFSPDGGRVVTASFDKVARLWDGFTGEPLGKPMRHNACVRSARFSPEGCRVVTASEDGTARIWDGTTGEPLSEPMTHQGNVWSAEFDQAGQRVLTASADATARVWDGRLGQAFHHALSAGFVFYDTKWSPDGRTILTRSGADAELWDGPTGRQVPTPGLYFGKFTCRQLGGFSPDGRAFLTAQNAPNVHILLTSSKLLKTRPLYHREQVNYSEFSADGRWVVTASADGTARVWDAATGEALGAPFKHRDAVLMARLSPSGQEVLTASADGTADVWDVRTGQALRALRHPDQVTRAGFSPDGLLVFTVCKDMAARVWDPKSGALLSTARHLSPINSAVFSPDGRWLLTASDDNTAQVWDVRTGQPVAQPLVHNGHVVSAEFRADGQRVLTASEEWSARLWDAQTGQCLSEPFRHANRVTSAHFSPDGTQVLTTSMDRTACIWDSMRACRPVARWLPALAECVAGRRLNAQRGLDPVVPDEWFQWRSQLTAAQATDPYTLWAKWFCADRSLRATSPSGTNTPQQFLAQLQPPRPWPCDREDLRKLFTLGCASSQMHLLWLLRWQPAQLESSRRELAELEWHSRKEFFRPEDAALAEAVYWARRGEPERMAPFLADATRSIGPTDYWAWEEWAELLFSAGRMEEGLKALARATEEAERAGDADSLREIKWKLQARLRWHRDRPGGQMAWLEANGVLPRPSNAPPNLIDLTAFYTSGLGRWLPDDLYGHGLEDLPRGIQQFGGTSFDVRGLIQLNHANPWRFDQRFPDHCSGIPINRRCVRLHFLHAADAWKHDGEKLGAYLIHYADGQTNEIPVLYGQDVLMWQDDSGHTNAPALKPVWQTNRPPGVTTWLFQTTWTNPHPEILIHSLDIVSAMANSGHFLVAITADP